MIRAVLVLVIILIIALLSFAMRNSPGILVVWWLTWLTIALPFFQFMHKQKKPATVCRSSGGCI